jgi:hypothetical protein
MEYVADQIGGESEKAEKVSLLLTYKKFLFFVLVF